MAIKVFDCKGYGQIEPSQVWFNRAGMSESQCYLDPEVFASSYPVKPADVDANGNLKIVAENGVFYMIDKDRKIVTLPTEAGCKNGLKLGINYSTERIYNSLQDGRRNFCMVCGEYLPRLGFVEPGMRICTNAIAWDEDTLEDILGSLVKDDNASDSVNMYNNVKAYLNKRKTAPTTTAPLYLAVTEASKGRLCLVSKNDAIAKGLGNVYGIITEAYYNADRTLSFKIMFIEKPQA